jgi:hypothetical protein
MEWFSEYYKEQDREAQRARVMGWIAGWSCLLLLGCGLFTVPVAMSRNAPHAPPIRDSTNVKRINMCIYMNENGGFGVHPCVPVR